MFLKTTKKPSTIVIQVVFINVATLLVALFLLIISINYQYKKNEFELAKKKHTLLWTELLDSNISASLGLVRNIYFRDLNSSNDIYAIRIADKKNNTVFIENPAVWNKYFYSNLDWENSIKNLQKSYQLKIVRNNKKTNTELEVYSLVLNNYYFQVVISNAQRERFLFSMLQNGLAIIIGIMLISFFITNIIITRVLSPLTNINRIIEDIISYQRIEQRLVEKGGGEFSRLQNNFNVMLDVIERQVNRLRQAAINLGHDIRTPLTRIRNWLEELSMFDMQDNQKQKALDCIEAIDSLKTFAKKVLDLSEIESGLVNMPKNSINVSKSLENIIDMYSFLAEEKQVEFNVSIDTTLHVYMDSIRLQQLVSNLLENAINFTPAHKQVCFVAKKDKNSNNKIYIEVRDEGIGIPQEEISKIWQPSWSQKNRDSSNTGSGFGLAIVESIVKAYHGNISCQSEVGKGSVFKIII